MKECKSTKEIKQHLNMQENNWKQDKKNPNCFTSNTGEALYVYSTYIKYWEDIRCHSNVEIYEILF